MKLLLVLLLITGACFAFDPDGGPPSGEVGQSFEAGTDDWIITLTSINDVSMSWGVNLRGCDYSDTLGGLLITDYSEDTIYVVNPSTGLPELTLACPSEIPQPLGICSYEDGNELLIYLNDWDSVMDVWEWSSFTFWSYAFGNPSVEPRGMAMDTDNTIWEMQASPQVLYHLDLTGSVLGSWTLSGVPSTYACACSVFPFYGDLGILIGGYAYTDFYFFVWDGANLESIGIAPVPQSIGSSYGVTYREATDSFYWVYKSPGGEFRLCEFTAEFVESLDQSTWGAIKSTF